jgi:hypothetical protein
MGSSADNPEILLNHAWKYFELHANQRMSLFNFFILLSGLIAAAWGAAMTAETPLSAIGAVMGTLLAFSSIIFWKIDERNSFLIKHAEETLGRAECSLFDEGDCLFKSEPAKTNPCREGLLLSRQWSHRNSFQVVFFVMGATGILGALYSIWPQAS